MRVLLVEDDVMIGEGLVKALADVGMSTDWVRDGRDAQVAVTETAYSIVLLDLGLPGIDGVEILRSARQSGVKTPVLILSARDAVHDRVQGLDLGADDYLGKPFEITELLARMRALIRRKAGQAVSKLTAGDLELNTETREMSYREIVRVLPAREYALMHALIERPGQVLSRAQIEDKIYGWGEEVESNAVDYLIHSLRNKFGKSVILNVRGVGWMIPRT